MSYCNICKVQLNQPGLIETTDCGGDCLLCMVNAGDPGCEHVLYTGISRQVRELVDKLLAGVHDPANEEIRQRLNEEFRFWRY